MKCITVVMLCLLLTLVSYSPPGLAAEPPPNEPISCLDNDLREAFFQTDYAISRELFEWLPPALRQLKPPEGFRMVGNTTSSRHARVGFITHIDGPLAEQQIVDALSGLGYTTLVEGNGATKGSGFRVQPNFRGQVDMCHPDDGSVHIRTRVNEIGTIVTATRYHQNDAICEHHHLLEIIQDKHSRDFMPYLELPEDARVLDGGGAGGGIQLSTSQTAFTSKMGSSDVFTFFGKQLVDQGWRSDGQWSTESTLGSVWSSFAHQGDLRLVGLLEITALDDTRYRAVMSVSLYD